MKPPFAKQNWNNGVAIYLCDRISKRNNSVIIMVNTGQAGNIICSILPTSAESEVENGITKLFESILLSHITYLMARITILL